ncbi:MAG: rhodanese-like domain-containing protein [Opitutaceae bacterium]
MPSLLKEFAIIAMLTALGVVYSLFSGLANNPWEETSLEAGEIKLEDAEVINPIWIDARSETEFSEKHIEGALLLNEENWDDGVFELLSVWLEAPSPIVVYCSSSSCDTSKRIAERLRNDLPDAEIYSLHGGWRP